MNDLTDLYGELLLDHGRRPHNRRAQPVPPAADAEGHNPMCGDRVRVFVRIENGSIADASFEGQGCAISTASASMMTRAVLGRTPAEARSILHRFVGSVTGAEAAADEDLGELAALAGVRAFPMRVKCATLAWHALAEALRSAERAQADGNGGPPGGGAEPREGT